MRRWVTGAIALAVVLSGCVGRGEPAIDPIRASGSPQTPSELSDARAGARATLLETVVPQWEPGPEGRQMVDEFGENVYPLEAPAELLILEQRLAADVPWLRVYVLPNQATSASDFFTWIPATDAYGNLILAVHGPEECPETETIEAIASISILARARCFGDGELTLEGVTWFGGESDYQKVEPSWLGSDFAKPSSVGLYAAREERGFRLMQLPSINVHVPPDVPLPPQDFGVRVHGTFNHAAAAACTRRVNREIFGPVPPDTGLTDGTPGESEQWCRGLFVATSWEIVTGPEGRAIRSDDVQLHRWPYEDGMCAGVGMGQMVFRIDPAELDPIWLETRPGEIGPGEGFRVVPFFGKDFRVRTDPELVVLAPAPDHTVIAREGQPLDPDAPLFGYSVCPMGEVVSITSLP
jgi:hypothetical protein